MTTSRMSDGGHQASGAVVLAWKDGTRERHEGDLPLVFESRGATFSLDGMHGLASLDCEAIRTGE